MKIKIRYFAWLRERVGKSEEELEIPSQIMTIAQLVAHLSALSENHAYAFETPNVIRAAINQKHVKHEALLDGAKEIAFFPPMTGG